MFAMDKHDTQHADTLHAAQQAIENSEQRECLLKELWEGLQLSPTVRDLIFRPGDGDPALRVAAEGQLLLQVQRLRGASIQSLPSGKRPLRPLPVRGLMI